MKITILDASSNAIVAEYVVRDVSMLSFVEWKDTGTVEVPLDQLMNITANLSSVDQVTDTPVSVDIAVDLFLPDHLRDGVLRQLEAQQTAGASGAQESLTSTKEVVEQVFSPPLKVNVVLAAVVQEVSQNHQPGTAFKVRISDER